MNILVIGGTKFFGVHMVRELLRKGHKITIATRGLTADAFRDEVERITLDHTNPESMREALRGRRFDLVIDKVAYCSNQIKFLMDAVSCDRIIYMSTTAVYELDHENVSEDEFDGLSGKLRWLDRADDTYSEVKRQAEYALWQKYGDKNFLAVRYPYVVGMDDYTKRLLFYVKNTISGIPMHIDNLDSQMNFINSSEAGRFIAHLADTDATGAVNGCSYGTISIREILDYVEKRTGKAAILSKSGESAPYNGTKSHTISLEKAASLGFNFSHINDWMYDLIDELIESEL